MARARAMRHSTGQRTIRAVVADQLLGRADLVGKVATRAAPAINWVVGVEPGTFAAGCWPGHRRHRAAPAGALRPAAVLEARSGGDRGASRPAADHRVTVFPTCLVEYRRPEIGHAPRRRLRTQWDRVRRRPGGLLRRAVAHRRRHPTVRGRWRRATSPRSPPRYARGTDVVVAQPTCHAVITTDYVDHVGGSDAELVAARTFDAVAYLADHVDDRPSTRSTRRHRFAVGAPRRSCPPRAVPPARRRVPVAGPTAARDDRRNGRRRAPVHGRRRQMGAARRQRADRPRHRPRARRRDRTIAGPTSSPGAASSPTSPSTSRPGGRCSTRSSSSPRSDRRRRRTRTDDG